MGRLKEFFLGLGSQESSAKKFELPCTTEEVLCNLVQNENREFIDKEELQEDCLVGEVIFSRDDSGRVNEETGKIEKRSNINTKVTLKEKAAYFRITSYQKNEPNGWLVNHLFKRGKEKIANRIPGIDLEERDEIIVFLGSGQTAEETYKEMLVYSIHVGENYDLTVNRLENESIDPSKITLRDQPSMLRKTINVVKKFLPAY